MSPQNSRLVARLHAEVGEAVAERKGTAEGAGRGRMSSADEQALAYKLIADRLADLADDALQRGQEPLDPAAEKVLGQAVFDSLYGLGRIQPLLDADPGYTDIHIAGCDSVWLTLPDGRKVRGEPVADSDEELVDMIATAARRLGRSERRWDYAHPELDMQLANGDRLHALMAVTSRPHVTIRRHRWTINRLYQLRELGMIDDRLEHFFGCAVKAGRNMIIGGGTGTGKTTMMRCLVNEVDEDERIITVEDSLELGLERFGDFHPDLVTLEARAANIEGVGEFSMAALVRSGLRMNPKRCCVGEIRGKEVLPMLLAMSQGNDGSMCTVHAESSQGVFGRLVMYAAMTEERFDPVVTNLLVANAVHLVVHVGWADGRRCVTSVREVTGSDGQQVITNEVFRPGPDGRAVPGYPLQEQTLARLEEVGFDRTVMER